MQSPVIQLFNQTACLLPIYPVYWENAFETCTDKIKDICSSFLDQRAPNINNIQKCLIQSFYEQLPSTSTFSSESLEKISNSTLNALKNHYNHSKGLRSPCSLFSQFMSNFYEEVEKDTEMTSLVSSAYDAISAIFAGINAKIFKVDIYADKRIFCHRIIRSISIHEMPTPPIENSNFEISNFISLSMTIGGIYLMSRIWKRLPR